MTKIRNLMVTTVVAVLVIVVSGSFVGSEILDRAIILGVAIDDAPNGKIMLTCEVVSPSNNEQVGAFSKIVTVTGEGVADCIRQVALLTGKEASLGQCVLLVLGQDLCQSSKVQSVMDYFVQSNSFKESANVCCCVGSAKQLMQRGQALAQSVSIALESNLLSQAKSVGVATNNLLKFALSQRELHQTGFLNQISFVSTTNQDQAEPDKPQGYFTYEQTVVFKNYHYVCTLNAHQTLGFGLLKKEVSGNTYQCKGEKGFVSVVVGKKSVSSSLDGNQVTLTLKLYVKTAHADSSTESGALVAKDTRHVTSEQLQQIKQQATASVTDFLQAQMLYDFDLVDFHEMSRQKQGTSLTLSNTPTSFYNVTLTVKVQES